MTKQEAFKLVSDLLTVERLLEEAYALENDMQSGNIQRLKANKTRMFFKIKDNYQEVLNLVCEDIESA